MKQLRVHTIVLKALAVCMVIVFAVYSGFAARSVVSDCINHGDVNLDGLLTAADAQLAFFITLGQYSPTYEEECAADCNGSGSVTSADAQMIFLTVLGTGECEDSLEPQTPTHAPTKTPTNIPTPKPTQTPTNVPTWTPYPTNTPTLTPTRTPTLTPTNTPTKTPTSTPTTIPTQPPTQPPTPTPTNTPTKTPTSTPTTIPTQPPTQPPTLTPTKTPTKTPIPTKTPTPFPWATKTPTPFPWATKTPTPFPTFATMTPTPTRTPTPTPKPGDLYATDPIVGNMRFVRAGTFSQGSGETEPCRIWEYERIFTHILTRNIAVMETEVSRLMWAFLQDSRPTLPNDPSWDIHSPGPNYPVQQNTWCVSLLFANLLSLQNGFTRCYYTDAGYTIPVTASNYTTGPFYCNFNADGYRLPTEGEWEYFTRAGTRTPFLCDEPYFTSNSCTLCDPGTLQTLEKYCVYCANNPGNRADVVGSKLPNLWNLKDVHGNIYEWCWDWWSGSYPTGTVTDYVGPSSGTDRVYRGGCFNSTPRSCRSASRAYCHPSNSHSRLGFRLVRTVSF